jgi:hypothetical protein
MTCTTCGATRPINDKRWTVCHSCITSPVALCPDHVHAHFATHEVRPLRDCPCAPVEGVGS